ncbi:hypothetical protein GCM10008916_12800 [Clostridium nitritogenes]|uniref:Peptidase MA-like domain-containing protein n=1 Tax=Clostridium nitritogenes TaxID=83340 RepID=A0ABN1LLY2_9CLOT
MTLYNELLIANYDNFKIYTIDSNLKNNSLKSIMEFILEEYALIFSKQLISNTECYIIYDPNHETPIFHPGTNPSSIFLNYDEDNCWAQIIYQLSHELCHYTLAQKLYNKDSLKWFEETLCEAFSLYILNFCSEKWSDCFLSKYSSAYHKGISNYLTEIYNKITTTGLKRCKNIYDLIFINETSEEDRIQRVIERNYVFNLFKIYRDDIPLITDYRKYIQSEVLIDFDKWIQDTNNNEFIIELSKIQPKIIMA